MKKNIYLLNYKQKALIFIFLYLIFLYLIFNFSKTKGVLLLKQYFFNESYVQNLSNLRNEYQSLVHESKTFNRIILADSIQGKTIIDSLVMISSRYNVIIKEISPKYIYNENNFNIQTMVFTFEGNFYDLVKIIYHIEKNFSLLKLSSLEFKTNEDFITKKKSLELTIFIQSFGYTK